MACDNCGEGWLGGCPACGLGVCGEFCSPEDDCFHEGCYFDAAAHPAKCSLRHAPLTPDEWSALRSATVCAICGGPAPCLEHPDTLRLPRCPRCGRGVQEHTLYDLLLAAGGDLVPCPSCDEDHDPAGLCGRCDGKRQVPRLSLVERFTLYVAIYNDGSGVWGVGEGREAAQAMALARHREIRAISEVEITEEEWLEGLFFLRIEGPADWPSLMCETWYEFTDALELAGRGKQTYEVRREGLATPYGQWTGPWETVSAWSKGDAAERVLHRLGAPFYAGSQEFLRVRRPGGGTGSLFIAKEARLLWVTGRARWDKRDELGDECAPEDDLAAAETVSTKGEPAGGLDT